MSAQNLGDTYLPCQLSKQPPEAIINVFLTDINLEDEAQKQETVGQSEE
jgi:hypothetical protein